MAVYSRLPTCTGNQHHINPAELFLSFKATGNYPIVELSLTLKKDLGLACHYLPLGNGSSPEAKSTGLYRATEGLLVLEAICCISLVGLVDVSLVTEGGQ